MINLDAPVAFDFEGNDIATWELGSGPDLVLIHGTPFSSHVWHGLLPELTKNYRVKMFDLLGYGRSAKPDGDVSLAVQNRLLAKLFEHWNLRNPLVIAHDFGGATALRAHFLNALDYGKLLLIDPVSMRPWGSPFVAHVREHETAFAGVPDYMQRAMLAAYIRTASHQGLDDIALEPYLQPWLGSLGQPAFYRQIAQMDMAYTDAVEEHYKDLRCPVHLLWGVQDQWIPIALGRKLAATLPNCTLQEVDNSGHLMQEDAPEAILKAVTEFFGEPS